MAANHDTAVNPEGSTNTTTPARHRALVAEDLVDALDRALPHVLASLPEAERLNCERRLGGVRPELTRVLEILAGSVAHQRSLEDSDVASLVAAGAELSRIGLDLTALDAFTRSAVRVAAESVLRRFGECFDSAGAVPPSIERDFANVILEMTALERHATSALRDGYLTEQRRRVPPAARAAASLVDRFLEESGNESDFASEARRLRLTHPFWTVGVALPLDNRPRPDWSSSVFEQFGAVPKTAVGAVRSRPVPHCPLLINGATPDEASQVNEEIARIAAGNRMSVVILGPTSTPMSLLPQYKAIVPALRQARAVPSVNGAVKAEEVFAFALLDTIALAARIDFFRDVFGAVLREPPAKRRALFEAVESSFVCGSKDASAELALVEVRTLYRHEKRVFELTSRNIQRPVERLTLEMALAFRRLAACTGEEFDEEVWGPETRALRSNQL